MTDKRDDVISVSEWGKLIQAYGNGGIPVPFVKEIYLLDSQIAGTGFVEDIETKTAALVPGSVLLFLREPENKHDPQAIQILNARRERIGYVPRADNAILSRLMDAGKLLYGKVKEKHSRYNWIQIMIEIYMRDL